MWLQRPEWLRSLAEEEVPADMAHTSQDGRVYLTTHTMEDGRGAFGYLAVTVAEDEPLWVGPGEETASARSRRPVACSSPTGLLSVHKAWSSVQDILKQVTTTRVSTNV